MLKENLYCVLSIQHGDRVVLSLISEAITNTLLIYQRKYLIFSWFPSSNRPLEQQKELEREETLRPPENLK